MLFRSIRVKRGIYVPRPKQKSPEQFIASSPIGEKLMGKVFERKLASGEKLIGGVFERNLASGALRLIEINGKQQELSKLGNKEEKIKGTLKSGYFGREFVVAYPEDAHAPNIAPYDFRKLVAKIKL